MVPSTFVVPGGVCNACVCNAGVCTAGVCVVFSVLSLSACFGGMIVHFAACAFVLLASFSSSTSTYATCLRRPKPLPRPRFPAREYGTALVDAYLMSWVRVVHLAYSRIASIHSWAMGAGIRCSRIWMVVSYELDRVVKIRVLMVSSVIFSVVLINFLRKAISLGKYRVTISSCDGGEAVNFGRT